MRASEALGGGSKTLNPKTVTGEPGTGYEAPKDLGEFECENCKFFTAPNKCNQRDMKRNSKQPRHPDGSVKVDPEGCCSYIVRIGAADKK